MVCLHNGVLFSCSEIESKKFSGKWSILQCQEWVTYSSIIYHRVSWNYPRHHRLLSTLLVALYNLMIRPYCWRQHLLMSSNLEKLNQFLIKSFVFTHCHSWYWKAFCYQRRKITLKITQSQTLQYIITYGTNVTRITNHFLKIRFKAHSLRGSPYLTLLKMPRNWVQIARGLKGKPNTVLLLKNIATKWFLMTHCYTHRSMFHSTLIREASSCCSRR